MKFSEGLNSSHEKEQKDIEDIKEACSFIEEVQALALLNAPPKEFDELEEHYREKFKKIGIEFIGMDFSVSYLKPLVEKLSGISKSSAEKNFTEKDKDNLMGFIHLVIVDQVEEFYKSGDLNNDLILDLYKNSEQLYKKLQDITGDIADQYVVGVYIKNFNDAWGKTDSIEDMSKRGYLRELSGIYRKNLIYPVLKDEEAIEDDYHTMFYIRGGQEEVKEEKEINRCVSVQRSELENLLNVFKNVNIEYKDKEVIQSAFQNFAEILEIHIRVKSLITGRALRRAYGEMLFDILDKFDSKINKFSLNDQFYIRLQEDVRAFIREANYR